MGNNMEEKLKIEAKKSAIVVIDLQRGITAMPTEPYSSDVVIKNTSKILSAVRGKKIPVFLVRVSPSPDFKDFLKPICETSFPVRDFDPSWSEYVPELDVHESDFLITKHQWGAFYGTELDLQLRRRNIDTILLCGIATNFGVESTARFAYEFGYNQIFVEDAMAARSKDQHEASMQFIFPRLGLIRKTDEVLEALSKN